jgi:group II intron reverse transcriptase/maturase
METLQQWNQYKLDLGTLAEVRRETSSEVFIAQRLLEGPTGEPRLLESILRPENMQRALQRVCRNNGAPGIDEITVRQMARWYRRHRDALTDELLEGRYQPSPARGTEIPKGGGKVRQLGIPVALDRLVTQATAQVLNAVWDHTFSRYSYGFRPCLSQHDAILQMEQFVREGYVWCVSIDLDRFFDRVHHHRLMSRLAARVRDRRVLRLINSFLKAGVMRNGVKIETEEGTPQGSPLSPLLSNIVLDELDKELERRGLRFVRFADDCVIMVRSKRAGVRVLKNVTRFIERKLRLKVNSEKSRVAEAWYVKFLGFSFVMNRANPKIRIHSRSYTKLQDKVRDLTRRKRGRSVDQVIRELNSLTRGWWNYFGIAATRSRLPALNAWIRRRLRALIWHQWKNPRTRMRHLKAAGVDHESARLTGNARKKAWRMSRHQDVHLTLSDQYFVNRGLLLLGS